MRATTDIPLVWICLGLWSRFVVFRRPRLRGRRRRRTGKEFGCVCIELADFYSPTSVKERIVWVFLVLFSDEC